MVDVDKDGKVILKKRSPEEAMLYMSSKMVDMQANIQKQRDFIEKSWHTEDCGSWRKDNCTCGYIELINEIQR